MSTAVSQQAQRPTAPPGFTRHQWEAFERDGIIFLEDTLSPEEITRYTDALDRVAAADPKFESGETFGRQNVVKRDPVLAELIDHPRHIGFAYDLFGEQLKLHISQFFIRPPGMTKRNLWHPDGARAVPYGVFSPRLPLQIKIGYWLTDLPEAKMGKLVVLPGSHLEQYVNHYDTRDMVPGELILSDSEWIRILSREQRIIMRSYDQAYNHAKPPATEFPLFLDRDTGSDRDQDTYPEHVALHRRKRRTRAEEWVAAG